MYMCTCDLMFSFCLYVHCTCTFVYMHAHLFLVSTLYMYMYLNVHVCIIFHPFYMHLYYTSHSPTLVVHDHCYVSDDHMTVAMETDSSLTNQTSPKTKSSEVNDTRKCLFCSVEGDAPHTVSSWSHPQLVSVL